MHGPGLEPRRSRERLRFRPAARRLPLAGPRRRGATLLELLVGLVIALMLTAAAIPLVRPALQGRRQRESARLISTYLEGIRARALESNASFGLWIEREPNNPHLSSSLYVCRVPEPYAGESPQSRAIVRGFSTIPPGLSPPFPLNTIWGLVVTPGVASDDILHPTSAIAGEEFDWEADFLPDSYVNVAPGAIDDPRRLTQVGDLVKLDFGDTVYRIAQQADFAAESGSMTAVDWLLVPVDPATQPPTVPIPPVAPPPFLTPPRMYSFQVFRRPQRTADRPLVLPSGMVIDLISSGVGVSLPLNNPLAFGASARNGRETFFPLQDNLEGNSNNGKRYKRDASELGFGGGSIVLSPAVERSPVVVLFGSSGTLERVYQPQIFNQINGALLADWAWYSTRPLDSVYLLLAKREQVPTAAALSQSSWPSTLRRTAADAQVETSWRDQSNLWIAIAPQAGRVLISPVAPPIDGLDQNFTWNQPAPRTIEWLYAGVSTSRRLVARGIRAGEE